MVTIHINGKAVQAEDGEMLLTTIRRQGIDIPALCHHDAVEPCGSCRLCMVEITKKEWNGWSRHVTSCLYPVEAELIIATHTPYLQELRQTIIELYMARSPHSEVIQKMAGEYGITQTRFQTVPDGDNCIMCYACTRICAELGCFAISAAERGHDKVISGPLREAPVDCVGCLSCAQICPTHFIEWTDDDTGRTIWERRFELLACKKCGKKTITKDFAEYQSRKRNLPMSYFDICDDCKRMELSKTMGRIVVSAEEATQ
ncbi:MAG: 2Fe-2S iron-sulfur cluster-binding protein [candidate division Zixibacteria bacterium]|nr:2Fe-2S iron-sulfur cluster-binding protein [candidate division Zixibacteria bacterium]